MNLLMVPSVLIYLLSELRIMCEAFFVRHQVSPEVFRQLKKQVTEQKQLLTRVHQRQESTEREVRQLKSLVEELQSRASYASLEPTAGREVSGWVGVPNWCACRALPVFP